MRYFVRFISAVLFFLIILFNEVIYSQSSKMKDKFYLGAFNVFFYENIHSDAMFTLYDSLFYNSMQNYCSHADYYQADWKNTQYDGGFFEPITNYFKIIRIHLIRQQL